MYKFIYYIVMQYEILFDIAELYNYTCMRTNSKHIY